MSILVFKPVSEVAMKYIAKNIREADRKEVLASAGYSPIDAIRESVEASDYMSVAYINDEASAIFGLRKNEGLSFIGVPWLLGTDTLYSYPRLMLKYGRFAVENMLDLCPCLINYVHAENHASIRWLSALGFTIGGSTMEYGVSGEKFFKFYLENYNV